MDESFFLLFLKWKPLTTLREYLFNSSSPRSPKFDSRGGERVNPRWRSPLLWEVGGVWVHASLLYAEQGQPASHSVCVRVRECVRGRDRKGLNMETRLGEHCVRVAMFSWRTSPASQPTTTGLSSSLLAFTSMIIMPSANVSVRSLSEVEKYLSSRMVSVMWVCFTARRCHGAPFVHRRCIVAKSASYWLKTSTSLLDKERVSLCCIQVHNVNKAGFILRRCCRCSY